MLEDYVFSDKLRYEGHVLYYNCPAFTEPMRIEGVLGAALLCAMLADTDEGQQREIIIDSAVDYPQWMQRYEREVRRDGWGTLKQEVRLLADAYVQIGVEQVQVTDICPNERLVQLAMELTVGYMQYLAKEIYGEHIWEYREWDTTFAHWLSKAVYDETERQRFLQMRWDDLAAVTELADHGWESEQPTLYFAGEQAASLMLRYFKWAWTTYQNQLREMPGVKPSQQRYKTNVLEQETDWREVEEAIEGMWDEESWQLWQQWKSEWTEFVTKQLKPERPILFYDRKVDEAMQERLTDYLRKQERQPLHYKCLAIAIYSLRYLGYVRRACSPKDMCRWLTDHLSFDYSTSNNAMQLRRAFEPLGRYTPMIDDELRVLRGHGIIPLKEYLEAQVSARRIAEIANLISG